MWVVVVFTTILITWIILIYALINLYLITFIWVFFHIQHKMAEILCKEHLSYNDWNLNDNNVTIKLNEKLILVSWYKIFIFLYNGVACVPALKVSKYYAKLWETGGSGGGGESGSI